MTDLVLSLFPGADLLGLAFEMEGFCVVAGPDVMFGRDIRDFHPPPGRFDGVIGGPPCQRFSPLAQSQRKGLLPLMDDLIPEFARCVREARPSWFLMENVIQAPIPRIDDYSVGDLVLNNRWFGAEQNRVRRFTFGSRKPLFNTNPWRHIEVVALETVDVAPCVTANGTRWERGKGKRGGRSRSDRSVAALVNYTRWQGLPGAFLADAPLTVEGKVRVIGNGVPLPMGRAVARAVREALLR